MKMYIKLLQSFQEWNPELVEKMRNCSHHFDSDNLHPYHTEGDVWTHTMMMYNDLLSNYHQMVDDHTEIGDVVETHFSYDFDELYKVIAIAILCHDTRKVYNRFVPQGSYGRIAMHGHAFSSVQLAIDFMDFLKKDARIYLDDDDIHMVVNVISNHMDYYTSTVEDRVSMANFEMDTFYVGEILNLFDRRNSMDVNLEFLNVDIFSHDISYGLKYLYNYIHHKKDHDIVLLCGCPGSGKDFIAERAGMTVYSFDDIRVELFLKDHPETAAQYHNGDIDQSDLYIDAFEYCNKMKFNLNNYLKRAVNDHLESEDPSDQSRPAIANTNLSRKARRSMASLFSNYNIKVIYITADSKTLKSRNDNRDSKNLSKFVMNKFMYNQQVPTMHDFKNVKNVTEVTLIHNG